jgi:MFS family permease
MRPTEVSVPIRNVPRTRRIVDRMSVTTAEPTLDRRGSAQHGTGFWLIAAVFLVSMAFSTVPTPLCPLYQHQDGFTPFTVTVVFAMYAVGVVTSLLFASHVSDWVGRKRVLWTALAVEALAAVFFLAWPALPGLLTARFLTGLGVGMITATATAYLLELHTTHRPAAGRGRLLGLGVATRYVAATTAMLWFSGVLLALLGAIALVDRANK